MLETVLSNSTGADLSPKVDADVSKLLHLPQFIETDQYKAGDDYKVLITHQYNYYQNLIGICCNIPLDKVWNIVHAMEWYSFDLCEAPELRAIDIICLLYRFYQCWPYSHRFTPRFDCQLDLNLNFESGGIGEWKPRLGLPPLDTLLTPEVKAAIGDLCEGKEYG